MIIYNLKQLLLPLCKINIPNVILHGLTHDSRNVNPQDLFIAINGHKQNGRQYISHAISNGAVAILVENMEIRQSVNINYYNKVPIIYINHLQKYLSLLAGEFYQHPAKNIQLIGVTGTNGKTTITHLIAQWTKYIENQDMAVMGTIGNGILNNIKPSINTTNSAIDIQQELYSLTHKKIKLVAIEVSSHALVQHRVASLPFTATVFSNLSRDHLDYHLTMKNYKYAKHLLFTHHQSNNQIINVDDPVGLEWITTLSNPCAVSVNKNIPINWEGKWLQSKNIVQQKNNTLINFTSSWGKGILNSPFIGIFNVTNIMLAMATLLMIGYPLDIILNNSKYLSHICGRMEFFNIPGYPTVIVDYAHTPDALKKVLNTIKLYCKGKIWCIFGCGGERDEGKRPLMGHVAEQYSDYILLTADNPRNENLKNIFNDILHGCLNKKNIFLIPERQKAIIHAITQANKDDYILIAGKGHETYQIIGNNKFYYSDRIYVANLLGVRI
uniref:UDP-N-acetylmuramoyl-L-alanyl-D-glutamate--2,6-diaminopimelate ligase n=1 Tax=Candidatus Aschnera chinzeii TaxID=1485666 RepID=A0AAT9G4M5_9ENTR|nr:MAG: UDP-N-acetylmuramoyl-L-alanyl-D-glutamate--2,6-diaminopimelate ligase [Candidatus Aschnera chinzeii]